MNEYANTTVFFPKNQITNCINRNKFINTHILKDLSKDPGQRCTKSDIYAKYQRLWDTKPNNLYYGINSNKNKLFYKQPNCENGYPNRIITKSCPNGYISSGAQKIDNCNKYYKKCEKKPKYKFSFTEQNNDIINWDIDNYKLYNSNKYFEVESFDNINTRINKKIYNIYKIENN